MKFSIKALLLILLSCYYTSVNAANGDPQACLPLGEACGIGVNGLNGAKCCPGTFCVSEVCKVFTPMAGGNPFAGNAKQPNVGAGNSNSEPSFGSPQDQQCKQKLKNAGCGHNAITALGPYCVCGCQDLVATSEQFASSCIPSVQDRIKLIRNCREYKSIRDCPQFKKQLTGGSPECLALKNHFTAQCNACGSRCALLTEEKSFEKR